MQRKLKLTQLSKEELRKVCGGRMGDDNCDCKTECSDPRRQIFGYHDSKCGPPIKK